MKGPYERLKYDLRRLWECPACKRRERTSGAVTFRFCPCGEKQDGGRPVVMQLIADGPQRLVPPIAAARGQCAEESPAVVAERVEMKVGSAGPGEPDSQIE
jgi:hypothetical protein